MENDEPIPVVEQEQEINENEAEIPEEGTGQSEEETIDWKAEAAKQKAIADRLKKKLVKTPQQTLPKQKEEPDELASVKQTVSKLELAERKRQFGYEHGLSPEETDAVFTFKPNPKKEDLENPFIKGGLETLRQKRRVEQNTPSPSSGGVKINGKDFKELSEEEKKANWGNYVESRLTKR